MTMLFTGQQFDKKIPMQPISLDQWVDTIRQPDQALLAQLKMLRNIRRLDQGAYRHRKTCLPWIIGATFRDHIRRLENFVRIDYLVIDLDHCFDNQDQWRTLRHSLQALDTLVLMHTSPGGEGLKLFFRLDPPLLDAHTYSQFYKSYAMALSHKYQLADYLDTQTHDATRISFISYDSDLYYQPGAPSVDTSGFRQYSPLLTPESAPKQAETPAAPEISPDIYAKIRQKLGARPPKPSKKTNHFVPDELRQLQEPIIQHAKSLGWNIIRVEDIHYGLKFSLGYGHLRAEINLFFGKRGFSIVKSPKRGTDATLNELAQQLIHQVVYQPTDLTGLKKQIRSSLPREVPPSDDLPPGTESLPF